MHASALVTSSEHLHDSCDSQLAIKTRRESDKVIARLGLPKIQPLTSLAPKQFFVWKASCDMKGKSYLVTGASRGVGLCLVQQLAEKPDKPLVFAAARSPEKYEEMQDLAKEYKQVHIIRLDLTKVETIKVWCLNIWSPALVGAEPNMYCSMVSSCIC